MNGVLPIGRRIAHARVTAGLSQHQLAERLQLSKSWVDKVERGIRAIDKVGMRARLADALGQDPDVLFADPAAFLSTPPQRSAPGRALDSELIRLISADVCRPDSAMSARLREMREAGHPGLDRVMSQLRALGMTVQALADMTGMSHWGVSHRLVRFEGDAHDLPVRDVTLSADEITRLRNLHERADPDLNATLLAFYRRGVSQLDLAAALDLHAASVWKRIRLAESGQRPARTLRAKPMPIPPETAARLRDLRAACDPRLGIELADLHRSGCWKKHLAEIIGVTPTGISYLIANADLTAS